MKTRENLNGIDAMMIKRENKYNYVLVIQQHYGYGWEDVSEYVSNSKGEAVEMDNKVLVSSIGIEYKETLLKHDVREYRLMGYPTRVIFRKELKDKTQ